MTKLQHSLQLQYVNKKILILGMGKEGMSTLNMLTSVFPTQKMTIMDIDESLTFPMIDPNRIQIVKGKERFLTEIDQFDVIFKTPSITIHLPQLQSYLNSGGKITSQLNEFLRVYHSQTIGVTGTKGKSTTAAFIYQLLQQANKRTLLAGNMGIPPFEVERQIEDDTVVTLEMSSFQLQAVEFSPHWAIWLNIFPEHLNYHHSFELYAESKAKITRHQKSDDVIIFNQNDPLIRSYGQKSIALQHPFISLNSLSDLEKMTGKKIQTELSDVFITQDLPAVLQLAKVLLIGPTEVVQTLTTFKPLPHRLEKITTQSGVIFIDDTLATIPEAAVAAINSFTAVNVILLGGFDRGIDYSRIVAEVIKKKIPTVIFFRPSGEKMKKILEENYPTDQQPQTFLVGTMEEAVKISYQHCAKGDIALLSPASPSFGQFKDYQDKASQFRFWISALDHA